MSIIAKKNLDLVVVALIVIALVMYDVTIELVLEFVHLIFEVFHNMFEWVELGIEHAVEHVFHTDRHGSQIITFYILCSIVLVGFWRFWKVLPVLSRFLNQWALESWERRKTQLQLYWQFMGPLHKAAVVITAVVVAYLASFFVM